MSSPRAPLIAVPHSAHHAAGRWPGLHLLAFCAALACSAPLQAAGTLDAPVPKAIGTLPTVVISESGTEQLRDDVPVSIDIFSRNDLEAAQITDIRGLVRLLPNVSVKHAPARFSVTGAGNSTGRDGNSGFNIRGLGGNRVLMLVDGVRLPHSYINGNNAFGRDSMSLDLLKRIELVRGPSSVLYGSDGLAGLVNYITYEPADFLTDTNGTPKALGGRASAGWNGENSGFGASATLAGRASDTAQWLISATTQRDQGVKNKGSNDSATTDRTTPNPQTNRSSSLLGKWVYQPSPAQKHVLTFEHAQKDADTELLSSRSKPPLNAASVADESAQQTLQRDRLTWDARYTLNTAWSDQLRTLLSWQSSRAQDDGRTARRDAGVRLRDTSYDERTWQAGIQASKTWPMSADWSHKLSYGLDYTTTDVSSWSGGFDPAPLPAFTPRRYFPDTRESSSAVYVQSEWGSERWTLTPGVRLERYALDVISQAGYAPPSAVLGKSLSGSHVTPKFGVLYRATPEWSIFGNYASGFRAPGATQVNGMIENPTPTTFVKLLANPDLKPETSRNFELGLRGRLERLSLDMAVFTGRFNQLIVDKKPMGGTGIAGNPLLFQSVNIDNATISGFEFKGNFDWGQVAGGRLSSPFAYGQTRGKNTATGQPLNAIDPAKLVLGVRYETAQWDWQLDVSHIAAKTESNLDSPYIPKSSVLRQFTVPAVTTFDLQGQWRIRKDLRTRFAVTNLTNRKQWLWSDVQGLAAGLPSVDAYTQPGRALSVSVIMDF